MAGIISATAVQCLTARDACLKALPLLQELGEGNLDPTKDIVTGNAALITEANAVLLALKNAVAALTT